MNFNGTLKDIKERGSIDKPIAVKKDEEYYILVAGMNRLCAAKLLGFKKIPAVVQEASHVELLLRYII
ncbi:MAG: ParB N-terminal domain-containing protein [Sedimentibacter sp.]